MTNPLSNRLIGVLPALLLVIIALFQIVQTQTINLTPWKGGGFGMFASSDGPKNRFIRVYLFTSMGEIPVEVPRHMTRLSEQVRYMPHEQTLSALADALIAQVWVHDRYALELALPNNDPIRAAEPNTQTEAPRYRALLPEEPLPPLSQRLDIRGVRVEVWRATFDTQQARVDAAKWQELTRSR